MTQAPPASSLPGNAGFLPTYRRAAPVFVRGEGAWLEDSGGKRYLDLLSGIGCSSLGHNHPRLTAAIASQAKSLLHTSNLFRHGPGEAVAQKLCELTGMAGAFLSNSGTEANECALKLARKHQRNQGFEHRTSFVALEHGFHGRTFGSVSITANPNYRAPFAPVLEARLIEPGDLDALRNALTGPAPEQRPAALVLEPVQGEGGVRPLCDTFLRTARELCDETGTVLVHDEVQCGVGRTGPFLAGDAAGVKPDVATLAKPIAGGLPMGVTLVREGLHETLQPGDHGTTFGGGPLASAAALVVLDEWEHGLADNIAERGAQLGAGLADLASRYDAASSSRGRGLIQGIVLPGHAAAAQASLFERGVISATAAGDVLRFLPPYVVTEDDIAHGLAELEAVLQGL